MSQPSLAENDPPRRSRARRREAMISATATILGCLALVVMIATVVRVAMVKLWESSKINPAYVQSVYDDRLRLRGATLDEKPAATDLVTQRKAASVLPLGGGQQAQTAAAASASGFLPAGIQNIDGKLYRIEHTLRGFFASKTVENRLRFVRDPERVRPLMESYYQSRPAEFPTWKNLGWVLPVQEPGYRLAYAQVVFADNEHISVIIEEMDDGSFQVDWESSVQYGEQDWHEFVHTRPSSPRLFRVIASKPAHMPDADIPEGCEVLEIKHPDENDVIYAHFERQNPKFQPLLDQLQSGNWKDVPLTLRLCYPGPAGGGKSASIADVEGKGWLILQGTRS